MRKETKYSIRVKNYWQANFYSNLKIAVYKAKRFVDKTTLIHKYSIILQYNSKYNGRLFTNSG